MGDGPPTTDRQRRPGRIDQVIEQLQVQISSGTWPLRSRIPTEPELVELTGAGRNTVREAVQALVHAGLLERRQGSGTYVVGDSELTVAVGRRMASAPRRHVLEVRRTLEVGAARLAACRRTEQDSERMQELLRVRSDHRARGDVSAVVEADVDLHLAIAQASGNPVLAELYRDLLDAISESVTFNVTKLTGMSDDDHVGLVQAIVDGDPDRAGSEAARFLDELLDHSEQAVESAVVPTPTRAGPSLATGAADEQ